MFVQWASCGVVVALWECKGSVARAPVVAAEVLTQFGKATPQTPLWPTQKGMCGSDTPTERPSLHSSDVTNAGGLEMGFKIKFEEKGESFQREKGWGMLPDPVGISQAAWSWIQCLHQFSLVFVSALKHSVWSKSYWIFTKPFLHAKAFSTLMFKKVPVAATVSSMCPYLFSL